MSYRRRAEILKTAFALWLLIFTLAKLKHWSVGFDYDDTLAFTNAAFQKGRESRAVPFSPAFWEVVNRACALDRPKFVPDAIALVFKLLGFRVGVLTDRGGYDAQCLRDRWRWLVSPKDFLFADGVGQGGAPARPDSKLSEMRRMHYLVFFGDSDSDIRQAKESPALAVRVVRSPESQYKKSYHPGSLGEWTVPFSQY